MPIAPRRVMTFRASQIIPATRAELAETLHISERTAQRRLDALAAKLDVSGGAGRERPRLIAARVIELGLDR